MDFVLLLVTVGAGLFGASLAYSAVGRNRMRDPRNHINGRDAVGAFFGVLSAAVFTHVVVFDGAITSGDDLLALLPIPVAVAVAMLLRLYLQKRTG